MLWRLCRAADEERIDQHWKSGKSSREVNFCGGYAEWENGKIGGRERGKGVKEDGKESGVEIDDEDIVGKENVKGKRENEEGRRSGSEEKEEAKVRECGDWDGEESEGVDELGGKKESDGWINGGIGEGRGRNFEWFVKFERVSTSSN
jgi:hypothetical protein